MKMWKMSKTVTFGDYMSLPGQEISPFAGSPENFLIIANNYLHINVPQEVTQLFTGVEFTKLFSQHIYPTHIYDGVNVIDSEETDLVKMYGKFVNSFIVIFLNTYEKYIKLLSLYKSEENSLMDTIKTTTSSGTRINEIPQTSNIDPYDERFVNQATKFDGDTSTDGNTKIARLKEIHDLYSNINEEWSKEFDNLFIPLVEE